jgi:hypothetical protein
MASLKADSPMTACVTRSLILTCLKIGTRGCGVGGSYHCTEQQCGDHGQSEEMGSGETGYDDSDKNPDCGNRHNGDPDIFQHAQPEACAAVKQDVT